MTTPANHQSITAGEGWELREEWRVIPLPGLELYEASSLGRIRSWATRGFVGRRNRRSVVIRPYALATGHLRVYLGRRHRESIHVLVATAFIGPRAGAEVCRHLDGNPANNTPDNLAWGTHRENNLDKNAHGTMLRGERHPAAKLTENDVQAIRASADSINSLSRRFGVSRRSVRFIRLRKTWTHVA